MSSDPPVRIWPRPGMVYNARHPLEEKILKCIPFMRDTKFEPILNEFIEFGKFINDRHKTIDRQNSNKNEAMLISYAMNSWEMEASMLVDSIALVLDDESPVGHFFGNDGLGNVGWWSVEKISQQRHSGA